MSTDLKSQIDLINTQLKDGEPGNIQEDSHRTNYTVYGYYPYDVFKAVNDVLGPEGWRVVVLSHDHDDKFAWCTVRVTIGEVVREQAGHSQVVKGAVGDALKGSITDATQKALSMFGIAHRAYRGLLKDAYGKPATKTSQKTTTQTKNTEPVSDDPLVSTAKDYQAQLIDLRGENVANGYYKFAKQSAGIGYESITTGTPEQITKVIDLLKTKIGE